MGSIEMKILIKGAGDLATGIASRLYGAGHQIMMTDIAVPLTVRRLVAFSRAVYEGEAVVEDMTAHKDDLGIDGVFASTSFAPGEDWRWQTHLMNLPIYYEYKDADVKDEDEISFKYLRPVSEQLNR